MQAYRELQGNIFEHQNMVRIKYWILRYLNIDEWPTADALKLYSQVDPEWQKLCTIIARYKNIDLILKKLTNLEFTLSFQGFDSLTVHKVCFPNVNKKINVNKASILCVEPQMQSDFIDNFIETFMNIDCVTNAEEFTSLHIAVHTYLHKIWLRAAKSELRPQLSGIVESSIEYDFNCRCSKTFLSDEFVFKNHKINVGLKIKIYYLSKWHKLCIRFIAFEFSTIPPLYTRKRPRSLPFDVLFDITSFLPRPDLDACQVTCRELFYFIENHHKNFALHDISTAKLITKGDFFCFGVFVEEHDNVRDFRERRSNSEVTQHLFYPLLRNTSINKFHITRIDFGIVFDHFKAGIVRCKPLSIRRIVFSAADTSCLKQIFDLTEHVLQVREYQIEVFSLELMKRLLVEPVIQRCEKFIVTEQYHSNQPIFDQLFQFLTHSPRPDSRFVLRNVLNEETSNSFLDQLIDYYINTLNIDAFESPILLVFNANPVNSPQHFNSPIQQNIDSAFEYETPTLSNVFHFTNRHNKCCLTVCLAVTMHSILRQRACHFKLGKITY